MKHIDEIFKNSEHEKELPLRPELWDRLERNLDQVPSPSSNFWRPWMVAASFILVGSLSILLYLNIERYQVEDLDATFEPHFSKEEISGLEEVYIVPIRIFVNQSFI